MISCVGTSNCSEEQLPVAKMIGNEIKSDVFSNVRVPRNEVLVRFNFRQVICSYFSTSFFSDCIFDLEAFSVTDGDDSVSRSP